MTTPHNNADLGAYADTVLMPGDPDRALHIAETFLTDTVVVNTVRNNYGFTGYYKGKRVSIQASGMGQPSLSIYATELFDRYDVKNIIRIGTCGSFLPKQKVGDCVIALSAGTDSNITQDGFNYAPCCDFDLLYQFMQASQPIDPWIGQMGSVDKYYHENKTWYHNLAKAGVVGIDMETHALYHIAAQKKRKALSVNIISDYIPTNEHMSTDAKVSALDQVVEYMLRSC